MIPETMLRKVAKYCKPYALEDTWVSMNILITDLLADSGNSEKMLNAIIEVLKKEEPMEKAMEMLNSLKSTIKKRN